MSLITGSRYVMIGNIILLAVSIFTSISIIRIIGNESYGVVTLTIEVILLTKFFITDWIAPGVTYFVARNRNKKEIISSVFSATTLVSSIGIIVIFFFSSIIANIYKMPVLEDLLKLSCFYVLTYSMQPIFSAFFMGLKKYWYAFLRETSVGVTKIVALILTIYFGFYGTFVGYINFYTFSVIFGLFYLILKGYLKKVSLVWFKKVISYSKNIFISRIFTYLSKRVGIIALGLVDTSSVTFFSMSSNIATMSSLIVNSISTALLPEISSLREKKKISTIMRRVFRYSLLIAFPISFSLLLLNFPITTIIFKTSSMEARVTLAIMSLQLIFSNAFLILSTLANALNKTNLTRNSYIISSVINLLILSLLLNYKAVAASFAVLISSIISLLYLYSKVKSYVKWKKMKISAIKVLISSIIPFLILYNFTPVIYNFSRLLKIVILGAFALSFLLIYFAMLILLKEIKKEDIEIVKRFLLFKE